MVMEPLLGGVQLSAPGLNTGALALSHSLELLLHIAQLQLDMSGVSHPGTILKHFIATTTEAVPMLPTASA